jgi:hypothetical protein
MGTKWGKPGGGHAGRNLCLPWSGWVGRVGLEPTAYGLKVRSLHVRQAILVPPDTILSTSSLISMPGNEVLSATFSGSGGVRKG